MDLEEMQKKYGIGLTGGVACGKSTVGKILRNLGYVVIDADQLSRQAVQPGTKGLARIVESFGGAILNEDSSLNRKMMGTIVFGDEGKRKQLEAIVHPIIQDLLDQELKKKGLYTHPRYWFYEAALLYEVGNARRYNQVWVVYCTEKSQIARIKKRDGRTREEIDKIISSQMSAKAKAKEADQVIDTSTPIEELEAKIRLALEKLPKL